MIKQRHDSVEQYTKGNRPELAAKEQAEIALLEAYLPQQTSEADLRTAAGEIIAAQGLSGPSATGVVMKAMIARFGATADSGTISRLVRELLAAK